jgi:hypothetical protein
MRSGCDGLAGARMSDPACGLNQPDAGFGILKGQLSGRGGEV